LDALGNSPFTCGVTSHGHTGWQPIKVSDDVVRDISEQEAER
jgi:hypothetical protein